MDPAKERQWQLVRGNPLEDAYAKLQDIQREGKHSPNYPELGIFKINNS